MIRRDDGTPDEEFLIPDDIADFLSSLRYFPSPPSLRLRPLTPDAPPPVVIAMPPVIIQPKPQPSLTDSSHLTVSTKLFRRATELLHADTAIPFNDKILEQKNIKKWVFGKKIHVDAEGKTIEIKINPVELTKLVEIAIETKRIQLIDDLWQENTVWHQYVLNMPTRDLLLFMRRLCLVKRHIVQEIWSKREEDVRNALYQLPYLERKMYFNEFLAKKCITICLAICEDDATFNECYVRDDNEDEETKKKVVKNISYLPFEMVEYFLSFPSCYAEYISNLNKNEAFNLITQLQYMSQEKFAEYLRLIKDKECLQRLWAAVGAFPTLHSSCIATRMAEVGLPYPQQPTVNNFFKPHPAYKRVKTSNTSISTQIETRAIQSSSTRNDRK